MSKLYFKCLDCNCGLKEQTLNPNARDFYLDKPEEAEGSFFAFVSEEHKDQDCPNNDQIKLNYQGIEMAVFKKSSLMTKEQKQEMLKKRSSAHFKKEIKEKSIEMQKNYYEKEMPKHIANNSKPPTI